MPDERFDDVAEVINWIKGKVYTYLNENNQKIDSFPISPENLVELLNLVKQKKVNRNAAKDIFEQMIKTGKKASSFAKNKEKITDVDILTKACKKVIEKCPKLASDYKQNPNALNSLLGQAMKETNGCGDAEKMKTILIEILK